MVFILQHFPIPGAGRCSVGRSPRANTVQHRLVAESQRLELLSAADRSYRH